MIESNAIKVVILELSITQGSVPKDGVAEPVGVELGVEDGVLDHVLDGVELGVLDGVLELSSNA
jgi:hypothetical protein